MPADLIVPKKLLPTMEEISISIAISTLYLDCPFLTWEVENRDRKERGCERCVLS